MRMMLQTNEEVDNEELLCFNVGGKKFFVLRRCLDRLPDSRLGLLVHLCLWTILFLALFFFWPFFLGPWTIIIQMEGAGSSLRKTSILWQNITWGGHRVLFWYVSQIVPSHSPASFFIHCWIDEIIALSSMWSPIDFGKTTLLLFAEIGKALATYWTCIGDSFLRSHKKQTVNLLACVAFL